MRAAASVDGHHIAIARDGELSLYTVDPLVEIARVEVAPCAHRTLAFAGRQVVVHDAPRLRVYSLPRLALTSELSVEGRLLATTQHYALFVRGDEVLIANCTSEGTAIAPTRTPAVVEHAVGLENARFLTWPKRGTAEIWDASSRLPAARVALEVPPDACAVGAAGHHRSVWIATSGGDLVTSRLSDGKTTVAPLPRPPHDIVSHPVSAWLVMDFDGTPHAVNSVLRTCTPLAIPARRPRVLAPSSGSHAFVIVDEGQAIVRYELGADRPTTVSIPVGGPLPEANDEALVPVPTPVKRVAEVAVQVEEPTRSVASRFAARPIVRAQTVVQSWRELVFAWGKQLEAVAETPLPETHSPLSQLADRAALDVPARRILYALYADWLAGHGDRGVAAARLVEIAGVTAWEEALGNGQLGKVALVTSTVGRCQLARGAGTFLDGREPEAGTRIDGIRTIGLGGRDIAPGLYRYVSRDPEAARLLATKLGTLLLAGPVVEPARLDAWLRDWPLVVAAPPSPLEPRPHERVVYIVDSSDVPLPDIVGAE